MEEIRGSIPLRSTISDLPKKLPRGSPRKIEAAVLDNKVVGKEHFSLFIFYTFYMVLIYPLLIAAIGFILEFVSLVILFKYFFKLQFNWLTLAGVLLVGSLLAGFFDGPYWWIGILIYIGLVSIAFYKKFHLRPVQILIAIILLVGISFFSNYFLLNKTNLLVGSPTLTHTDDWVAYTSSQDNFSILFPKNPTIKNYGNSPGPNGRHISRFYKSPDGSFTVGVSMYLDFNLDQMSEADKISFLRNTFGNPQSPSITVTTFMGEPAISYADPQGVLNSISVIKRNKVYLLQVVGAKRDPEGKEKFFNSFKIF